MDVKHFTLEILFRDYIAHLKSCVIDSFYIVLFVIKPINEFNVIEDVLSIDKVKELEILLKSLIEEESKLHSDKIQLFNKYYKDLEFIIKIKDNNQHLYYNEKKSVLNYEEIIDSIKEIKFGDKIWLEIELQLVL